jgi:hypothetical protein
LAGWKIVLGIVGVRDFLKVEGKVYSNCGTPDSAANVAAFLTAANMKDMSAKSVALRLKLGVVHR